ncbi:hypothetical protein Syun_001912 [Stephania yunnanensis]|uniref:Uncharacterized protein n=1 Tax=Stephania yunnanensis TaxID=152371 RepID=A0AAP0LGL9_9MAGN
MNAWPIKIQNAVETKITNASTKIIQIIIKVTVGFTYNQPILSQIFKVPGVSEHP